MDRPFELDGEYFTLAHREIRNFYLRLQSDGSAHVSVPLWATDAQIEAFLRPRLPWLRRQREALETRCAGRTQAFEDGRTLWLFGQRRTLQLTQQGTPGLTFFGDTALLCCARGTGEAARRALVEQAFRQALAEYLGPRIAFYSARMGIRPPQVSIRLMRTRWGSCTPAAGRTRFNLRLAQKPESWIDYVVVHELAHLCHADHSPAFWALVERYFPDWRSVRQALNTGAYESL